VPEFTGNVHNLELALPFPTPDTGTGPYFAVGRTFGADGSDALDVWIDDANQTTYDPPDGDPVPLPIRTLLAVTHGWLSFVAADQAVPGLRTRDGSPLVVRDASLVLEVWSTLRASLDRMADDGSYFVELTESGRGGRPALKYLLYENVDPLTLDDAIAALIAEERPDPFFSAADRAAMVQQFKAGEIRILARAGRVIGQAAAGDALPPAPQPPTPPGPNTTWRRLTFRAADRLGQLFDPGFFFRRVQELADIQEVPVLVDKTLIPSRAKVKDHVLPGMTPRRLILDWRDEFGRPVPGARFSMSPATGAPGAFVTTDAQGLWVGPTLASDANPRALTEQRLTADREAIRLGTLPDAARSEPTLIRDQMADDYLVVSAIDLEAWFPARPAPQSASAEPLRRFSEGNRITALIDARRTYSYVYRALRRTFRDDDFDGVDEGGRPAAEGPALADPSGNRVYIAGWRFAPELWLPDFAPEAAVVPDYNADARMTAGPPFDPRGHLMGILRGAIEADVDVRALLWHQQSQNPDHHTDNTAAVLFLDRPEGGHRGQAIRDGIGRTVGSHHQKAVVVQNADGRLAFVGGIDLARGRWDAPEHEPNDERAAGGRDITNSGWHDTHTMIEGPAVDDVETNFRQRWNAHPDAALGGRTPVPARPLAEQLDPIPQATHFVQVNRTIPTGVPHFSFVDIDEGDDSARRARINAILRAKRYVYIEEQYLTHFDQGEYDALLASPNPLAFDVAEQDTVAAALRHRLVGPDPLSFVAILIPRKLDEEPRFANGVIYELRKRFVTFLTHGLSDADTRDRLLVFHLRNRTGQFTYVHAKNMIVDDLWASIGSSNLGYRSLTYDTEINCDVVDGQIVRGVRRYARNFRVELWRNHLRLGQGGGPLLVDPRRGFEMLRSAAEGTLAQPHAVVPYDPAFMGDDLGAPGAPPLYDPDNSNHEIVRTHLIDPDGRTPDDPLLDYFALIQLIS
jgi:phosphatidylserine/phosphatidylglycerophosphate/cardiolipin synthase-like enzyme